MNKPEITRIEFTKDEQDIIKKINEVQPVQSVRTKVSEDGIRYCQKDLDKWKDRID